ncbi:MAG: translesion DNA synthesis-associated protein ImuA [Azonexus sp.]|jgi:cell division inhibitor SulA/protein ImuA|uniref:translesion DNA synthesis-associated protein ImuA n=1 Tax=Azonexus sp. TaxID=1872668 RepID=UPI0028240A18|nr:translesion DNA synthesis-associated protein ImuA [Azonexus sp.]MDR0775120.1 translesion DNA synthesis-associated protein ImuA [Azonexus sp.]
MNAAPLAEILARGDIWRGDALAELPAATIPSGHAELDAELPGGGWPCGALIELLATQAGIGEMSLLLPALARLSASGGWLALVAPPWQPHGPACAAAGLHLERLVVVRAGRQAAWCCEQLIASGGFAGVLAWPERDFDARALRRLQVAAEGRRVFAALWRPVAAMQVPSPAPLRIVLDAVAGALSLQIIKRRGRPAARPLNLAVPRPGRNARVVASPAFSPVRAGIPAAAAVA